VNRDEILDALSSEQEFRAAPNYGKDIVENLIRVILNQITAGRRDPDRWEEDHIALAHGHLLNDRYFAAFAAAVSQQCASYSG
jgi:predicted Zn-dependent peptidase